MGLNLLDLFLRGYRGCRQNTVVERTDPHRVCFGRRHERHQHGLCDSVVQCISIIKYDILFLVLGKL